MATKRIAFLGLGRMGEPMVSNLLRKGFVVTGYDILDGAGADLVDAGMIRARSPADAARDADVLVTMVPGDEEVEAALLGADGAAETLRPGGIWLQMSTIKPGTLRRVAERVAERGARTLDCPVSRGGRVVQGELSVFVGGDAALLEEAREVLLAVATDIVHCGALGMGQAAKLVNNMLSMTNLVAAAEGLLLGLKQGLDPEVLYRVVNSGNGTSVAWRDRVPQMIRREFEPEVRVYGDIGYKDISLAIDSAEEAGTPVMLASVAREIFNALRASGGGKLHYVAIITVLERMAGIPVAHGTSAKSEPSRQTLPGPSSGSRA